MKPPKFDNPKNYESSNDTSGGITSSRLTPSRLTRRFFTNPNYAEFWSTRVRKDRYEETYRTEFLKQLRINDGDLVLEVGVGEGRNASKLVSEGVTYVGVDISKRMLGKAREGIRKTNFGKVDLLIGDALWLPFRSSSFDESLCFATIFFVPDQKKAIKEILSVSRSRVGFEFRNSLNPRIFLYTKAVAMVNLMHPLLRYLLPTKSFRRVLSIILGSDRAQKLTLQLSVYDSLQPLFPITASRIRSEINRNGWTVESLQAHRMLDLAQQKERFKPKQSRFQIFDPVLIAHVADGTTQQIDAKFDLMKVKSD